MEKMKVYTLDESIDRAVGVKGSPNRQKFDAEMEDFLIGVAIREARESMKMTQEQLGEKIGVKKARISSIEKGANLRLSTLRRIFRALGMEVDINIKNGAVVHLC